MKTLPGMKLPKRKHLRVRIFHKTKNTRSKDQKKNRNGN